MTALEFGKRDGRIDATTALLVVLIIASCGVYAMLYIHQVSLGRDIQHTQLLLEKAQVKNADLKNDLYSVLDSISPEDMLSQRGLVLDRSPEYALPQVVAQKDRLQ